MEIDNHFLWYLVTIEKMHSNLAIEVILQWAKWNVSLFHLERKSLPTLRTAPNGSYAKKYDIYLDVGPDDSK